jgi:hypothetical protein
VDNGVDATEGRDLLVEETIDVEVVEARVQARATTGATRPRPRRP